MVNGVKSDERRFLGERFDQLSNKGVLWTGGKNKNEYGRVGGPYGNEMRGKGLGIVKEVLYKGLVERVLLVREGT